MQVNITDEIFNMVMPIGYILPFLGEKPDKGIWEIMDNKNHIIRVG